jgi:hypothetical protein
MQVPIRGWWLLVWGVLSCQYAPCATEPFTKEHATELKLVACIDTIELFEQRRSAFPTSLEEISPPQCREPECYFGAVPQDAWGTAIRLQRNGRWIRVDAAGADRAFGTKDDLFMEKLLKPLPPDGGG